MNFFNRLCLKNIFNRTYLKLALISIGFAVIFCFICNIMIESILNTNMKLVCDVYYEQISSKVKSDISLLKSANEYLANNEIVVEYLREKNKDQRNIKREREKVLNEVRDIEKILSTISLIDSINIIDIENK